jgi:AcrR family transcriptional regulator
MTTMTEGARERILRAADELFYARGIRNVGIDEVIAKAGVAKASLYKHFESKDMLVMEWLRQRSEAGRKRFLDTIEQRASTPKERVLAIFDELEANCGKSDFRGCAFLNAMVELADPNHPAHRVMVEHKQSVREYMRKQAEAAGLADPEDVSYHLAMLYDGAVVSAQGDCSSQAAHRARHAAEKLLEG